MRHRGRAVGNRILKQHPKAGKRLDYRRLALYSEFNYLKKVDIPEYCGLKRKSKHTPHGLIVSFSLLLFD